MIYTSYFGKINGVFIYDAKIAICLYPPHWWKGLHYPRLAPTASMLEDYHDTGDVDRFTEEFNSKVLGKLNAQSVLHELNQIAWDRDIVLLCHEPPGKFCHRKLVAKWFKENGIEVKEF